MSPADCRGSVGQGTGKRFKGVENFLKRVAFNLGNSPSQTEVKIISCIPIDVSDLQQKIVYLEKQLEDSRTYRAEHKRVCNTAVCDKKSRLTLNNTGISCNMLDIDRGTNPHEDLSKNKIKRNSNISFVTPHDSFENEQHEECVSPNQAETTNLYENLMKSFTIGDSKSRGEQKHFLRKKNTILKSKKPRTEYVYYAQTKCSPFNYVKPRKEMLTRSYLAEMIDKQYKPRPLGGKLSDISKFSSPICKDIQGPSFNHAYETDICSCCHGTFHNIDDQIKHNKSYGGNDRIEDGGYYDSTLYDMIPVKEKPVKMKRTADLPKRREPKPSYDIKCWPEDVRTKFPTYPTYSPLYHNYNTISRPDMYYRKSSKIIRRATILKHMVKPRIDKEREIDITTSKSCSINFGSFYPKVINKKLKIDKGLEAPHVPRKADAECSTNPIVNNECQTNNAGPETITSDVKTEETLSQIKSILQSVLHEVKVTTLKSTNDKSKKDAVVQKGISHGCILAMQSNMPPNLQGNITSVQGYTTGNVKDNMSSSLQDCMPGTLQDKMPNSLQESKLDNNQCNMPKILQANMTASLQNNMLNNMHGNYTAMMNLQGSYAGSAQDNLPATFASVMPSNMSSRFLNSCTFSPFNLNPQLPSCSKQINASQVYHHPGLKCYQNFPIMLQPQRRQQCNCYRHSAQAGKTAYLKQATTIATNTDTVKEERSKETEKLIKEIYKSMALSMGVVHKDNSLSEYEPVHDLVSHLEKPTKRDLEKPLPGTEIKKVTNVAHAVSELFRKKDMQVSSETPNTTTESRLISKEVSTRSQLVTTTTTDLETKLRKDRLEKFLNQPKHRPDVMSQEKRQLQTTNAITTVTGTETTSSDTGTGANFVPQQSKQVTQKEKKEKQSLLSKMLNTVKLFKQRERRTWEKKSKKVETQDLDESSSDSDDYQTIYSQKIETAPKPARRTHNLPKRRTHSKISYKQPFQPRDRSPDKLIRRSPYLEQEYRRHWNEKLMFHDTKNRQWPEHPYSVESPRKMPYYQTYETRNLSVEPRRKVVHTIKPVNAEKVVTRKEGKNLSKETDPKLTSKGIEWLKKHKIGIHCGEQWKKLILDG